MKPHIAPYRRHDRPGKWSCQSPGYIGTGYTPLQAYIKWLNAVLCCKVSFWSNP